MILQASHSEPAIRYAVTALGALHEKVTNGRLIKHPVVDRIDIDTDYPLRQYTKALGCLRNLLSTTGDQSLELALICSYIFVCFEILQKNYLLALTHLQNSLRVLCWQPSGKPSPTAATVTTFRPSSSTVDHDLTQAFVRLDVQASTYLGLRLPGMIMTRSSFEMPFQFATVREARDRLDSETNCLYYFLRSTADDYRYRTPDAVPLTVIAEAHGISECFRKWGESFSALLNRPSIKIDGQEQQGINVLLIQHKVNTINIATCLYAEETIFDEFDAMFDEIVTLASPIVHSVSSVDSGRNTFCLDTGVVPPLYFTAMKCRCPWIRQRAVSLLYSMPCPEGVWNGVVMAKIAERLKAIEEDVLVEFSSNSDRVPEFWRVHSADMVDINLERRCAKVMFRQRLNGMDGEWDDREDWVTW
ncbi:MAG: hypothetical protein M1830_006558 [Pleopsidium flavum]|nr:MAG: hypothetical protein M1830_006558 [Pleopsidium flavum]